MILCGELVDDSEDELRGGDDDNDDYDPPPPPPPSPPTNERRRSSRLEAEKRRREAEAKGDDSDGTPFVQSDEEDDDEQQQQQQSDDEMPPLASSTQDGRQSLFDRVRAAAARRQPAREAHGRASPEYDGWKKGDTPFTIASKGWGHPMKNDAASYDLVQRFVDACVTAEVQPPTPCDEYTPRLRPMLRTERPIRSTDSAAPRSW